MTKNYHKDFVDKLVKDPVELKKFLFNVMGPPRRTLEGKEREHALLLLAMIEPFSTSNNQHSWTDCYMIGNTEYHVTTFPGDTDIVDEILSDD
jgi:hypothetical protein